MEKLFIKNRHDKKISVLLDVDASRNKLAIIMHGLGGFKEQSPIEAVARAFADNGFNTLRFDTTHSIGESEGTLEDGNITNYYEDLEDVIKWASTQSWFIKPFALAGHSLGAFCAAYYAEKFPEHVFLLAPLGTVVAGELSLKYYDPRDIQEWRSSGYQISKSNSKPGVIKKLKWNQFEADMLHYDLRPAANKLKMPVLLICGEKDFLLQGNKIFFDLLIGPKEIHTVKNAFHTFHSQDHIDQLYVIMDKWLKKYK